VRGRSAILREALDALELAYEADAGVARDAGSEAGTGAASSHDR
jgi:hypothetical protein